MLPDILVTAEHSIEEATISEGEEFIQHSQILNMFEGE